MDELKIGGEVTYCSNDKRMSRCLTIGKPYKITRFRMYNGNVLAVYLIDDNGRENQYSTSSIYRYFKH